LILLTDGRANVSIGDGDPWQEALAIASELQVASLVIDTEVSDDSKEQLRRSRQLADQLEAKYVHLDDLESAASIMLSLRGENILARR
jgi:magnesium chelatase subunit D